MIHNIVVVSNSKQVINDVQKGTSGKYGQIIEEIKLRALHFNCISRFENRSTNFEADVLAKHSHSSNRGLHVWLGQPHNPICILRTVEFE